MKSIYRMIFLNLCEVDKKISEAEKPIKEPLAKLRGEILELESIIEKIKSKTEKLFDCVVKKNLEDNFLTVLEGDIFKSMQELKMSYKLLDERRIKTREGFDNEVPEIIIHQRGKQ